MALVTCPDCSASVSDRAPACPKCGAPIASVKEVAAAGVPLTTTQVTSKRLKGHILISALLFWGGVLLMFTMRSQPGDSGSAPIIGSFAITIGLIWYVVTKARIWWHHK